MCGRFSFVFTKKIIEKRFDLSDTGNYEPRYNCAPSQKLAVITNQNPDKLSFFKWGLVPSWAKDTAIGNKMINAKAETITEKPSFKNAIQQRRCLIPVDSFYEWNKEKEPYHFFLKGEEPFALAGIWDSWKDQNNNLTTTFSIITTEANDLLKLFHTRMPAIIDRNYEKKWLLSENTNELMELLKPYDPTEMVCYKISKLVNSAANETPEIHQKC